MAISSLGVGSNLDLSGLLEKLAVGESQPLVALKKQQASYTAKLSAYGTLQNVLSSFQAAAKKLSDASLFQAVKVTSSATDILAATGSATSAVGGYSVEVTQLARAQSLVATGVTDPKAAVGQGSVTIDFGTVSGGVLDPVTGKYSGAAFAPDAARTAQTLVIDSSNNSLEGLRDAINKSAALGVTASIINDGGASPFRLVLNSSQTGAASSLRIAVTGDASLQSLVAHDYSAVQSLQQTAVAANAALKVNGIGVASSSNTVKDAVQGVTMTLSKAGSSTLTVSRDNAATEAAVNALVNTYNSLQTSAAQLTKYDPAKKVGAALVGDSTLRSIQSNIRAALNTPEAGDFKVLSKVGISFQKDGTIALDADKLRTALTDNREAVIELFAGTGGDTGFGKRVSALVQTYIGSSGAISNATAGVSATLKSLDIRYTVTEASVEAKVARYRAQFTQLDLFMSRSNSTTSYLKSQFEAMNASK